MTSLTKHTKSLRAPMIKRAWHVYDAKDKILGRLSTEISTLLIGKHKPTFSPHMDDGDHVIVINAKHVKVTGKKEQDKIYTRYSGYPGGLKKTPFYRLQAKNPEEVIKHAVSGMLPKNKLRSKRIKRLHIFSHSEHNISNALIKD